MLYYGHRGNEKNYIENTMESFINCFYKGIETDLRLTKDGKIILYHDDDLSRLYNIDKKINNLTYKDILSLNKNILLLDEFLHFVKIKNKNIVLDIKETKKNNINYIINYTKLFCELINYDFDTIIFLVWTNVNNIYNYNIFYAIDEDIISETKINELINYKYKGVCLEFTNTNKNNISINNIKKNNLLVNTYTQININNISNINCNIDFFTC